MTLRRPVLVSSCGHPAPAAGQTSCANPFDQPAGGRGRGRVQARRAFGVVVDGPWLRRQMPGLWSDYCRAVFVGREACAAHFGVTFQTACNWWDGVCAPHAAVYARASIEDGARLMAVVTGAARRAGK